MKLGVLILDDPLAEIKEKHGDYGVLFKRLFLRAAETLAIADLVVEPFDVYLKSEYPSDENLKTLDGLILTGSKHSAYDNDPWILKLKDFVLKVHQDFPTVHLLGICFGHQILAEVLGGKVEKNPKGWEVGRTAINLTMSDGVSMFSDKSSPLHIQSMHQDHVTKVPVGFRVLASSPVSPVQIMVLPNRHFCIQGHPEFVSGHIRIVIEARLKKGIFSAEFAEACFAALELPVDDLYFAQVMLKFVQGTIQF